MACLIPDKPSDSQSHTDIDKRLTRKLKTYGIKDPPFKRGKDIPLGIVHSIVATATSSSNPKARHIADLVQLSFYFCLIP